MRRKKYKPKAVEEGHFKKVKKKDGSEVFFVPKYTVEDIITERQILEAGRSGSKLGQIIGEEKYPRTLREMQKIFKGAEEIIVPRFVQKFAEKYPLEVGGVIRAYPLRIKNKKVVVVAPRMDKRMYEGTELVIFPQAKHFKEFYLIAKKKGEFRMEEDERKTDKMRAKKMKKQGLIGTFHTHPKDFERAAEKQTFFDVSASVSEFLASLVLKEEGTMHLPFKIKESKLKTKKEKFKDYTLDADLIKVSIRSDREVWNLLRKIQKKRGLP